MDSKEFDFSSNSHRRYNPLTDSYVLCSPHRSSRPWQGLREEVKKSSLPAFDPQCYLCPGNTRANGEINPKYETTYIFPNDFPAVKIDQPDYDNSDEKDPLKKRLLVTKGAKGKCFVICFSPNHNLTLPLMSNSEILNVVNSWQNLYADLKKESSMGEISYKYLQIFENKGLSMGCSNPHPHGQAWCLDMIPTEVNKEINSMTNYYNENHTHLLDDYVKLELKERVRIVCENESFIVVVPFWALWPFETLLISKQHLKSIIEFNDKQKTDLAAILKVLTTKYDNLFSTSFPYSMGIHQAPLNGESHEHENLWFHMHFYPPLLRSASVRKFCVGFEMLGEAQRDITCEQAASRLQALDGSTHYLSSV